MKVANTMDQSMQGAGNGCFNSSLYIVYIFLSSGVLCLVKLQPQLVRGQEVHQVNEFVGFDGLNQVARDWGSPNRGRTRSSTEVLGASGVTGTCRDNLWSIP